MRGNGCNNILWVPGTGYQSQYAGFAKYPIQGENIGYAVHVYPGWYGSDAMEPSHELGGSYGGGFQSFAAGWASQIEPCAAIAPIIVTEMDWMPSKYNKSWGKSITGKMLGNGFGANFKVLADRTGNVSWMIFTGPELIGKCNGKPAANGNYDYYNDPEGCLWPTYHWYKEYAGESLPQPQTIELCFSPRTMVTPTSLLLLTGDQSTSIVIGTNAEGYERNLDCNLQISVANPNVVKYEKDRFIGVGIGTTQATVKYEFGADRVEKTLPIECTPFPFKEGYFNPSIYGTGSFDEASHTITTDQYGFAGWKYAAGLDLSKYKYLFAELGSNNPCSISFRVFDKNNYWSDCSIQDFGNNRQVRFELNSMYSNEGRRLDPSHLYYVGFWSTGGQPFVISNVYATNNPTGIESVEDSLSLTGPVDVYNSNGMLIRSGVERSEATDGLPAGLYIIGNKKVIVR